MKYLLNFIMATRQSSNRPERVELTLIIIYRQLRKPQTYELYYPGLRGASHVCTGRFRQAFVCMDKLWDFTPRADDSEKVAAALSGSGFYWFSTNPLWTCGLYVLNVSICFNIKTGFVRLWKCEVNCFNLCYVQEYENLR